MNVLEVLGITFLASIGLFFAVVITVHFVANNKRYQVYDWAMHLDEEDLDRLLRYINND